MTAKPFGKLTFHEDSLIDFYFIYFFGDGLQMEKNQGTS